MERTWRIKNRTIPGLANRTTPAQGRAFLTASRRGPGRINRGRYLVGRARQRTGGDGAIIQGSNFGNTINTTSNVTVMGPGATISFPLVLDVDAAAGGAQANIGAIYGHGKGTGAGVMGVAGGALGANSSLVPNAGVAGYHLGTGVAVLEQ